MILVTHEMVSQYHCFHPLRENPWELFGLGGARIRSSTTTSISLNKKKKKYCAFPFIHVHHSTCVSSEDSSHKLVPPLYPVGCRNQTQNIKLGGKMLNT